MKAGKIRANTLIYSGWQKIYETTLTEAATSVTISGLTGDTDKEYKLVIKHVLGGSTASDVFVRLNNDSGSNYGFQRFTGSNTSTSAQRLTAQDSLKSIATGVSEGDISLAELVIHAISGYIRVISNEVSRQISGTTNTVIGTWNQIWNNTVDEITQINIIGENSNCLGIGTTITLWKQISAN